MYAMKCSTHSLFYLGCGGTLLRWLPDCGLGLLTSGTWSTLRDIMNINQMCVSPLILLKVLLLPKPKNTQQIQFAKVQQIFFFQIWIQSMSSCSCLQYFLYFQEYFHLGPARQPDWHKWVCVCVTEGKEGERMGGSKSLAYTAISDHLELLWQWSSVAYQDSLGDRGVHSGNSSCYQGAQRWQVVLVLESILYNFNCSMPHGWNSAPFPIISSFFL